MRTGMLMLLAVLACGCNGQAQAKSDAGPRRIDRVTSYLMEASAKVVAERISDPQCVQGPPTASFDPYCVRVAGTSKPDGVVALFTTPFLRLGYDVYQARLAYKRIYEHNIAEDRIAPVVDVFSFRIGNATPQRIVLLPAGQTAPEKVIAPHSEWDMSGAPAATYPLSVLSQDVDVHVIYDRPVPSLGGCTDCVGRFDMDGVK